MDSISRALLITGGITADLDPNAFGFTNVGGANLSTLRTSNTITPTGYDAPTAWSVTNGGQGSVNGGTYASSGTISPGQTFTVRGTSSASYSTGVSFLVSIGATQSTWSITTIAMPTEAAYTTPGTYTFIVPAGVTSASVVSVGGGGGGTDYSGGGGGGLNYRNNISLTPGQSITITVGSGGTGSLNLTSANSGTQSVAASPLECGASGANGSTGGGRSAPSGGGGNGGQGGGGGFGMGGGGAAGYSGTGGAGGATFQTGQNGSGGGGGGGGSGGQSGSQSGGSSYFWWSGGGGGGVGIYGQSNNGTGGLGSSTNPGQGGGGGSGGGSGGSSGGLSGVAGGLYGGGGSSGGYFETYGEHYYWGVYTINSGLYNGGNGQPGFVRIIWPGNTRLFPSTNTGAM